MPTILPVRLINRIKEYQLHQRREEAEQHVQLPRLVPIHVQLLNPSVYLQREVQAAQLLQLLLQTTEKMLDGRLHLKKP